MATMLSARCPACQITIRFDQMPELGLMMVCPECEAELEVMQLQPLKLRWADEDDYDDFDDDFDDDPFKDDPFSDSGYDDDEYDDE
jgi:lysine biosynthesis protein LysW